MGERVVVEVELHSGASFQQVNLHIPVFQSTFDKTVKHLLAFSGDQRKQGGSGV